MEAKLRIYFGTALANLYTVGYLSTDIHKLIAFSEAVQREDELPDGQNVSNWFNYTNRYTRVLEEHAKNSKISRARNGSLELLLAGMGIATSIVVPIAVARAQNTLSKADLRINFEVSPTDKVLDRHVKRYARGDYGKGVDGLNNLFGTLSGLGYDVCAVSDNTYQLNRAIDVCAKRIVKTVRYAASS